MGLKIKKLAISDKVKQSKNYTAISAQRSLAIVAAVDQRPLALAIGPNFAIEFCALIRRLIIFYYL